jgi:hypothetical protein
VDDQILGSVLRGDRPAPVAGRKLFTTGYWYVRLCQAVLAATGRPGVLAGPFVDLPQDLRTRAVAALLELPEEIGLISLRSLAPQIGTLRRRHQLNILGLEVLAAARQLGADVYLSAVYPRLEDALEREGLAVASII